MTRVIFLLLIFITCNSLSSQVFEISNIDYLTYMVFMTGLDLGNNYIDDIILEELDDNEIIDSDWDDIPFFDNWISYEVDHDLKDLSDYAYIALLGSGIALTSDKRNIKSNIMILSKILITQSAVGKWVKTISSRKRPYVWHIEPDKKLRKNQNSFYSLHSSGAFAIATYAYYYHSKKRGKNILLASCLYGGAALTAALRVASAQHFPSDVVAGALAGTLLSYLICRDHYSKDLNIYLDPNNVGIYFKF